MNVIFRLIGYFEDGGSEVFGDFEKEEFATRKVDDILKNDCMKEKPVEFEIRHYVKIELVD